MKLEKLKEMIADKALVYISAEWCGPCKKFGPTLECAREDYMDTPFAKVDANDHQDFIASLNVRSIPTLIYFKNNKEEGRLVGAASLEGIKSFLSSTVGEQ